MLYGPSLRYCFTVLFWSPVLQPFSGALFHCLALQPFFATPVVQPCCATLLCSPVPHPCFADSPRIPFPQPCSAVLLYIPILHPHSAAPLCTPHCSRAECSCQAQDALGASMGAPSSDPGTAPRYSLGHPQQYPRFADLRKAAVGIRRERGTLPALEESAVHSCPAAALQPSSTVAPLLVVTESQGQRTRVPPKRCCQWGLSLQDPRTQHCCSSSWALRSSERSGY